MTAEQWVIVVVLVVVWGWLAYEILYDPNSILDRDLRIRRRDRDGDDDERRPW